MIPLTCDRCEKTLRVRDELAGKRIKCPGCGGVLAVPLAEIEDDPPPARPKRRPVEPVDEDDDREEAPRKKKPKSRDGKPSVVFLIAGLFLGLGGLIAMSAFIYLAKSANDSIKTKERDLGEFRESLQLAVVDSQKQPLQASIEKTERAIVELQSRVRLNIILAIVFGFLFLAGAGIRGYHYFAMKKWYAEFHEVGKKKKKKRRPVDDDEDDYA